MRCAGWLIVLAALAGAASGGVWKSTDGGNHWLSMFDEMPVTSIGDIAIESAGMTLIKGDLRALVRARRLSKATMRNIRQNLFFAFAYNMVGVPVAAGVLYPFFGTLMGWLGVALTGSDTASNVLFGGMQKVAAEQLGLSGLFLYSMDAVRDALADAVEAATRSLRHVTPENLGELVDNLIRDRLADRQFDEAPLTFADLAQVMADASICGLGQAAPNPLLSVLKHFPQEVQ